MACVALAEPSVASIVGAPVAADSAPAGSRALARRDAVVRVFPPGSAPPSATGCGGVLITPRVVLCAAHCGFQETVRFGQAYAASTDVARVIQCYAHPGALLGAPPPSCSQMGLEVIGLLEPSGRVTSLDWVALVLDRRVDFEHGTAIQAIPMPRRATAPPLGAPLRWASMRHLAPGTADLAAGRVFTTLLFDGLGSRGLRGSLSGSSRWWPPTPATRWALATRARRSTPAIRTAVTWSS
jgi:hypothetical protein